MLCRNHFPVLGDFFFPYPEGSPGSRHSLACTRLLTLLLAWLQGTVTSSVGFMP